MTAKTCSTRAKQASRPQKDRRGGSVNVNINVNVHVNVTVTVHGNVNVNVDIKSILMLM